MNNFENMSWSPFDYAKACVLAREVGDEILSRLDWMTLKPKQILDVGCGLGEQSVKLKNRYPEAQVFALDMSEDMLCYAKNHSADSEVIYLCGDGNHLPLANQSVDLIFANFFLPWQVEIKKIFREWRRVLRPDGLLMFNALGPDTMKDWHELCVQMMDMHDVGDLLQQEGFADPVLDVDYFTIKYREQNQLQHEVVITGFIPKSKEFDSQLSSLSLTYEIIYAHAFAPSHVQSVEDDGTIKIPFSELRKNLKMRS